MSSIKIQRETKMANDAKKKQRAMKIVALNLRSAAKLASAAPLSPDGESLFRGIRSSDSVPKMMARTAAVKAVFATQRKDISGKKKTVTSDEVSSSIHDYFVPEMDTESGCDCDLFDGLYEQYEGHIFRTTSKEINSPNMFDDYIDRTCKCRCQYSPFVKRDALDRIAL